MKTPQLLLILGLLVVMVGGGWYVGSLQNKKATDTTLTEEEEMFDEEPTVGSATTIPTREGSTSRTGKPTATPRGGKVSGVANLIVVVDQKPAGMMKVNTANLSQNGYVVIKAGEELIGNSLLLEAGAHEGVEVPLARDAQDGETLSAMLYTDTDENGEFDDRADQPIGGEKTSTSFKIDVNGTGFYE